MTAIKVNLDVLLLTTVHLMKQKSHREFDSASTYISLILTVMYSHFMYIFSGYTSIQEGRKNRVQIC